MRHLDLFSGIGGFALAVEEVWGTDVEHIFCDIEPFSQRILAKHWPNSLIYGDIRELTADKILADTRRKYGSAWGDERVEADTSERPSREPDAERRSTVDILTGGFPCQPFSAAGARRGTEDDRHLWPEMLRVIRETNPTYIVGENVGGFLTWNGGLVFEQVCTDLEEAGYEVCPFVIPAAAVNAPHRRDRVWIVANAKGSNAGQSEVSNTRREGSTTPEDGFGLRDEPCRPDKNATNSECKGEGKRGELETERQCGERGGTRSNERDAWNEDWLEVATRLCRVDDGLPKRLDRTHRLKSLGNAIVPQVAAEIMQAIKTTMNQPTKDV